MTKLLYSCTDSGKTLESASEDTHKLFKNTALGLKTKLGSNILCPSSEWIKIVYHMTG